MSTTPAQVRRRSKSPGGYRPSAPPSAARLRAPHKTTGDLRQSKIASRVRHCEELAGKLALDAAGVDVELPRLRMPQPGWTGLIQVKNDAAHHCALPRSTRA